MKKIISIFIALTMITGFVSVCTHAVYLDNNTTLVKINGISTPLLNDALAEAVEITEDEASEIAKLFIQDKIAMGDTIWSENTSVTNVVNMYSNDDNPEVTAYTVNLNQGYVVVSAYLDASSLIPEWSDKAEPIYENFENSADEKIMYLGAYEYYIDAGDTAISLQGEAVEKDELCNNVEISRDISNIPTKILQSCAVGSSTISPNSIITDPFDDANNSYPGPFVCKDFVNKWEDYMTYYTTGSGLNLGWDMCCTPVAITNILMSYRNKRPSTTPLPSADNLFTSIAQYGFNKGYYKPTEGGTHRDNHPKYLLESIRNYSMGGNVVGLFDTTYTNIKSHLNDGKLLLISLQNHGTYGNHSVVCFAYTRLYSANAGNAGRYIVYMKVADGWYPSARYIDLLTANDAYNCKYTFADIWG